MIAARNLTKLFKNHVAVDNISLSIDPGTTLALVGESGSGKSTLGKMLLHLILPTSGAVYWKGVPLSSFTPTELKSWRKKAQIIFQDPYASLNPRMRVDQILEEPLIIHKLPRSRAQLGKALTAVQLSPSDLTKYPHEFSGGQRQRIGIARALMSNPEFVVCDESVASLDSATQMQVLTLLKTLQKEHSLTYLFISHDLRAVQFMADQVAVMQRGSIVEMGPAEKLFSAPEHAYTQELIAATIF